MIDQNERHARAFPDLEPPPGGLLRLRQRLRPRPRALVLAFVPALAAAAAIAIVVTRPPSPSSSPQPAEWADNPSLSTSKAPVVVDGAAGVAVPLSANATLYWVP